jgi:hypothetical protein
MSHLPYSNVTGRSALCGVNLDSLRRPRRRAGESTLQRLGGPLSERELPRDLPRRSLADISNLAIERDFKKAATDDEDPLDPAGEQRDVMWVVNVSLRRPGVIGIDLPQISARVQMIPEGANPNRAEVNRR